eukprot:GEMP01040307.1.p1 GENE.GEMP01040307.1~~GEMP01040307.1.p1  ORF type:complete len:543 (+),score=137.60 GEMP01040307.1:165-1793(+)
MMRPTIKPRGMQRPPHAPPHVKCGSTSYMNVSAMSNPNTSYLNGSMSRLCDPGSRARSPVVDFTAARQQKVPNHIVNIRLQRRDSAPRLRMPKSANNTAPATKPTFTRPKSACSTRPSTNSNSNRSAGSIQAANRNGPIAANPPIQLHRGRPKIESPTPPLQLYRGHPKIGPSTSLIQLPRGAQKIHPPTAVIDPKPAWERSTKGPISNTIPKPRYSVPVMGASKKCSPERNHPSMLSRTDSSSRLLTYQTTAQQHQQYASRPMWRQPPQPPQPPQDTPSMLYDDDSRTATPGNPHLAETTYHGDMPVTLQVHRRLFEEIIQRDVVFGKLLQRVRDAYDIAFYQQKDLISAAQLEEENQALRKELAELKMRTEMAPPAFDASVERNAPTQHGMVSQGPSRGPPPRFTGYVTNQINGNYVYNTPSPEPAFRPPPGLESPRSSHVFDYPEARYHTESCDVLDMTDMGVWAAVDLPRPLQPVIDRPSYVPSLDMEAVWNYQSPRCLSIPTTGSNTVRVSELLGSWRDDETSPRGDDAYWETASAQ